MVKTTFLWKMVVIAGGAAVTLAVIRTVYYYIPWGGQEMPPAIVEVPVPAPSQLPDLPSNPLLAATKAQFWQWMPPYCGADLFKPNGDVAPHRRNLCVNGTIDRVQAATGRKITPQDVMDPAVRQRWFLVMAG